VNEQLHAPLAAGLVDKAIDTALYQLRHVRELMLARDERDPRRYAFDSLIDCVTNEAKVIRDLGAEMEREG